MSSIQDRIGHKMLLALSMILIHTSHVYSFNLQSLGTSQWKSTDLRVPFRCNVHKSQLQSSSNPIQSHLHLQPRPRVAVPTGTGTGSYVPVRHVQGGYTCSKPRNESMELRSSTINTHTNHDEEDDSNSTTNANKNDNVNMSKSTKMTIFTILIATTLNLLGFTLTSPLNPTLGQHFNLPTGASFGSLTSAYPAGMLLGQFTWPRLSDSLGRKKILAFSLLGSGMGLSLQAMAVYREWSLGLFLATRVFTGVFSGSAPEAKAFLADIGDEHSKSKSTITSSKGNSLVSKYLGWRDAASTLSYMVGPALGGVLYESVRCWNQNAARMDSSMRWMNQGWPLGGGAIVEGVNGRGGALAFVIGISALGSLIASLMVMAFVRDTSTSPGRTNNTLSKQNKEKDVESNSSSPSSTLEEAAKQDLEIISCPLGSSLWTGVATVCIISFLYHIADSTFFAFYPALLQTQMGYDARSIGMSFTAFAAVSFLCSATSLSSKLIEKAGVVNACATGLAAIGVGLLGLSTSASSLVGLGFMKILTFGAAALYFAGVPLYGPTVPTMLLQCVPPYQRGAGKFF